jgi:membrane fusion protein, multidrug efflux system
MLGTPPAVGRCLFQGEPSRPVEIVGDAVPGATFRGRVREPRAGHCRQFSVITPESATGNFTKIVQRVPVRILFDADATFSAASPERLPR